MKNILAAAALLVASVPAIAQKIEATVPSKAPLHGRLIIVFSKDDKTEPRMQLDEQYKSAQGFGVDVGLDGAASVSTIAVDAKTFGYPLRSLADIPAGDYFVQGVFNVYDEFRLGSGKTVWLAPDKGEGQHWNRKPGNPYSKPVKVHFDPKAKEPIKLTLDQSMPAIAGSPHDPEVIAQHAPEAKWLRYMKFKSDKLTAFWGRDTYLGAWVLLPDGFDEHPNAHYPLVVWQDHYNEGMRPGFTATPPTGANARASAGYRFYQDWTQGRVPRVIILYVQNANPYYDDSYVVDSANVGPYGSAVNDELIPAVEAKYRGIGAGWARATAGGSTGGWESLATQILYPDRYNGTWSACPDPVDFHGYQNINLYDDVNAFVRKGDFGSVPVAGDRLPDGSIIATAGDEFAYEQVLGTRGRSTEQWAIWQAVFSPQGADGYPAPVLDPITGVIDKKVVQYWHDHWDLAAILKRDWPTLGPKLEGKIHIQVGDGDTYFLNNAVHLLDKQLQATTAPHSDAQFQYGPGMPHCYTGGPSEYTMQQNSANWAQRIIPQMTEHMVKTAPAGADVKSWMY
ncbi:Putative esterase [Granulicella rosea]|uniref:Putative esterase n=1 Tax=Granulicella rosea TaxID=474952 RepID=A0A239M068_9BACT|nr:alpha/beta hydrolase-fold protein [Granulicella rosea]SNT35528.1 Putative esterase [Granulicella rosea]